MMNGDGDDSDDNFHHGLVMPLDLVPVYLCDRSCSVSSHSGHGLRSVTLEDLAVPFTCGATMLLYLAQLHGKNSTGDVSLSLSLSLFYKLLKIVLFHLAWALLSRDIEEVPYVLIDRYFFFRLSAFFRQVKTSTDSTPPIVVDFL